MADTFTNITDRIGSNSGTDVSQATGVLVSLNGGTGSTTPLTNNKVMISSGGAIVENAALTATKVLVADANGLPSTTGITTSASELNFVSGTTSNIQSQLNTLSASVSNKADMIQTTAPTSGATVVISTTTDVLRLTNGGLLTTLIVQFPTGAQGKRIRLSFQGAITALTLKDASGATVSSSIGVLSSGFMTFNYDTTTWVRTG